jgi:hypothetical protein
MPWLPFCLAQHDPCRRQPTYSMLSPMFVISEEEAAAIRATYEQRGEFSAAIELRQLFPGITDNAQARECARTIASWRPLPKRLRPKRLRPDKAS